MSLTRQWPVVIHFVCALLCIAMDCLAGTSREKAIAAVAVVRAQVQIANDRPSLPDTRDRFPSAKPNDIRQKSDSACEELAKAKEKINEQAFRIAELKIANHRPAVAELRLGSPSSAPLELQHGDGGAHSMQPMSMSVPNVEIVSEVLPAQLVVGGWEKGCPVCNRLEADFLRLLSPLGWKIGRDSQDQIQFVHIPNTEPCPRITLYQNGNQSKKWDGYQDPAMLSRELRKAWDEELAHPQIRAMSTGSAGTIHAAAQIRRAISHLRTYVGEGNSSSISWDRNGASQISLLAKSEWAAEAIFGTTGRIQLASPNAIDLPLNEFAFDYRIAGRDVVVDADPVRLAGLANKLAPNRESRSSNSTSVGVIGIDDMLLIYNVFSMIRDIFSLLRPSCDVILPGQLSASAVLNGDTIVVEFIQPPTIRLVWLFTFNLTVKEVVITESNVHVKFRAVAGSRVEISPFNK